MNALINQDEEEISSHNNLNIYEQIILETEEIHNLAELETKVNNIAPRDIPFYISFIISSIADIFLSLKHVRDYTINRIHRKFYNSLENDKNIPKEEKLSIIKKVMDQCTEFNNKIDPNDSQSAKKLKEYMDRLKEVYERIEFS